MEVECKRCGSKLVIVLARSSGKTMLRLFIENNKEKIIVWLLICICIFMFSCKEKMKIYSENNRDIIEKNKNVSIKKIEIPKYIKVLTQSSVGEFHRISITAIDLSNNEIIIIEYRYQRLSSLTRTGFYHKEDED